MGPTENPKVIPSRVIRIIAFAMHASILIYGYVLFTVSRSGGWTSSWDMPPERKIVFYVLVGMSAVCGALSLLWPRFAKEPLFFDFSTVTQRIHSLTVLRMALAEAIALYGFVLAYLNQSIPLFYPFAAVGLFLQVLVGPFGRFLRGS